MLFEASLFLALSLAFTLAAFGVKGCIVKLLAAYCTVKLDKSTVSMHLS